MVLIIYNTKSRNTHQQEMVTHVHIIRKDNRRISIRRRVGEYSILSRSKRSLKYWKIRKNGNWSMAIFSMNADANIVNDHHISRHETNA